MHRFNNWFWLRTTMGQERFSKLSTLSIERELTNKIAGETILQKFAFSNRKLNLV